MLKMPISHTHIHTHTHTYTHMYMHTLTYLQPDSVYAVDVPMDTIQEEDTTSNEGSEHNQAEPHDSTDNIKLQRVAGVSLRHTKQPTVTVLKEGWMVHYTNKSAVVGGA